MAEKVFYRRIFGQEPKALAQRNKIAQQVHEEKMLFSARLKAMREAKDDLKFYEKAIKEIKTKDKEEKRHLRNEIRRVEKDLFRGGIKIELLKEEVVRLKKFEKMLKGES